MSKKDQVDLEAAIAAAPDRAELRDTTGQELTDPFTGVVFRAVSRNHYEFNDGVPVAPPLDLNRPTIRQRIENLLNRDPGLLQRYMMEGPPDGQEGIDMEVPDDPDAPMTASEQNYIDMVAAELAEQAPLPDEGLPRPTIPPASPLPAAGEASHAADAPGGGSPAASKENASAASPAPPAAAPARAAAPRTVPTR